MSNEFRNWEELSDLERAECTFSDMYKDAHGFRPRGVDTSNWTLEDFGREFDRLEQIIDREETERIAREQQAITHFEHGNRLVFEEFRTVGFGFRVSIIEYRVSSIEFQPREYRFSNIENFDNGFRVSSFEYR